ncbi:SET domain-containing protein [Nonomuraea wenchangensis]
MPETPAPHCLLHPAVEVRPSPIAGDGLFAMTPLPAGTVVSRLGGRLVTWDALRELLADPAVPYVDTVAVGDDLHLVLPPGSPSGKGNHGCDPNLWWSAPYTLVARRDVSRGEELTLDYATCTKAPGFVLECRCGAPLCRGRVTGEDWKRADLRERYGDHWSFPLVMG